MKILHQPYPFYEDKKGILLRLFIISASIIFVLTVLQPFGTDEFVHPHKNLFLSGYGVIAFVTFALFFLLLPKVFPQQFIDEKWKVWKQIALFSSALLLTFLASYLYLHWFFESALSLSSFLGFGLVMGAIAFIPTSILTAIDFNRQFGKHQSGAKIATANLPQTQIDKTEITLYDENQKNIFTAFSNEIFFIQAANNYVEIHYKKEEIPRKILMRNSLSKIEKQLSSDNILRCHRSYLVNINLVEKITGNAQGYHLHFTDMPDTTVPVSRKRGKEFLAKINKNA